MTRQNSDTNEFSISSRKRRTIKGKLVHQNNKKTKINLRRNISSIAQSRALRKKEKEMMKQQIEDERRKKIMDEQRRQDKLNLEGSPAKKSGISKSPNVNYLISVSPQTSIALMNQKEAHGAQKRSESEKLVPVSDAGRKQEQFRVKEEPANMKKFQESRGQQDKKKRAGLEDSVDVKNFDSMEINRVTVMDYQVDEEGDSKRLKPPQEKPVQTKAPKANQFRKRTPLHKKKSKVLTKTEKGAPKREAVEDFTIDEIELKKMETNELLEYYDRQYQASMNENQATGGDTHTETHNQTMNTTDMLNEQPNHQSFTKDQIELDKELKADKEDSIEQVDTTNVIHREVHDPQVKKAFQNRNANAADAQFKNEGSGVLSNELLTKTQTQIKRDLDNSREQMKKHLMSKADSKLIAPKSPNSKLSRHQIPATRKVTPSSGQEIVIPDKKKPQTPQAIGRTEPKRPSESREATQKVRTPSLQSTVSGKDESRQERKVKDDESQPDEINYSGMPDIPMTSHIENQDIEVSSERSPEQVKNYDFLGYQHDSNLQTESEVPMHVDEKKDPFAKSLDSRARQMIENGKFRDESEGESEQAEAVEDDKSLSDFDNQTNQNNYLLSDMGDVSQKDRKSLNQPERYPGLIFDSKSEAQPKEGSTKEIAPEAPEDTPGSDDDLFLLNPTKSPNMRKIRKSRRKKKKPKKRIADNEVTRNPFHETDEDEEQAFMETQPKVDISGDFQIKTMTTPNIKKKKRKKRSKKPKKRLEKEAREQTKIRNAFGETHPPKKAYNLLDQHKMVPQFHTLGDFEHNQAPGATIREEPLEARHPREKETNANPQMPQQARGNAEHRLGTANNPGRYENNFKVPKMPTKHGDVMALGDRFTLGNNIERYNQNWNRLSKKAGSNARRENSQSPDKQVYRAPSAEKESETSIIERRNNVKKLLRKSRKKLQREIDETNSRRSQRSRSLGRSGKQGTNDSFEHENKMNKYAIKGIDREKLKKEVYLKHSILQHEIPEINMQLQRDLENYKVFEVKKSLRKAERGKSGKKGKRDQKDRLRKLEREIANLTKNVEQQVEDNEEFKAKVHRRYEDED